TPALGNVIFEVALMRAIAGLCRSSFAPESWTSVWGITSLFVTVSVPCTPSVRVWVALNAPPFTAHEWQPHNWCRIVTVPLFEGAANAGAASPRMTTSTAAEIVIVRFVLIVWLLVSRFAHYRRGRAAGHRDP